MGCFGSSDPNAQLIKEVCRGKTEEQKKVIEYFCKQERVYAACSQKKRFYEL